MATYPTLIIHQNKTNALKRFHPWVFSGAVKQREGNPEQGDVVELVSERGEFLGLGHFGTGSVSARLFSFKKTESLEALWLEKFRAAYEVRRQLGLTESETTNAYRLINAEGDGMPGLIVDWYNGTAVVQCHSKGMHRERGNFAALLQDVYGERLKAVYDKSAATLHHKEDDAQKSNSDSYLLKNGEVEDSVIVKENGHSFRVNWVEGQKTGFFIDQRDNRLLLARYAAGKKVLNTFCYSGGFSVYALNAGASLVHSVDSSEKAIQLTEENVRLNAAKEGSHASFTADVFDFLRDAQADYDIIVLDPPAFAKSQSARHNAIKAYTRLNQAAFKKIKSGGMVFTFSCSQVVSPELFEGAVTSAAIDAGRNIRVIHHLHQAPDHPISIFNPEALYLKGLVLHVE